MNSEEKTKKFSNLFEEIIGFEELKEELTKTKKLIAYDGYEPSGKIHIAQGLMRAIYIKKLQEMGIEFKILIADWLAFANNKMNGNMEKIQETGRYYIEVWKSCGIDTDKIKFYWTSEFVKDDSYWLLVMKIAKETTLQRIIRCSQVMGRSEKEILAASQILYPCMQAADAFYIGANINQMGIDQRKVNILTRQVAESLGFKKPIAAHHHMLTSLLPPSSNINYKDKIEQSIALKMSKSKPGSAIFMSDTRDEVSSKILKAYCPPKQVEANPILEYFKYIVFPSFEKIVISREDKHGGDLEYTNYQNLENDYINDNIFALDLKNNLSKYLNILLDQSRDYFSKNKKAKKLQDNVISYLNNKK